MSRLHVSRLMATLCLCSAMLGGCSSLRIPHTMSAADFGETTVVGDAPLPIVQSGGTAIAGWSSVTMRETEDEPRQESKASGAYKLDSGDKLRVFVYAQPSLSRIYTIDNEGFISVPLIGNVQARGISTRGLEATIMARLGAEFVRDPHVTVDIQQYRPFFILGEIRSAGQYPYVGGLTVDAAVAIAGGFSDRANERKVQITRRINGEVVKLDVPGDAHVRPGDTISVKERWF
jgi:polysaccharide biosynthesis/export protein